MLDIRPVLFINGFLLLILAAAMGVPLAVDVALGQGEWQAFLISLMLTGFIGLGLIFSNRAERGASLRIREAFLVAGSSWVLVAAFGALPFQLSSLHMSLTDGLFETISGITTTGATVITGLDEVPGAILVWRALLQWLGGAGVIVAAIALWPALRIGGMQMFRMESSDKTEKVKPRVVQVVWHLLTIYAAFTAIIAIGLFFAGMTPLEAACHAMSALATGGFSTSDQSLGHFSDGARWICVLGMVLGGASFAGYVAPWERGRWDILRDSQIRWYLSLIGIFSLAMTAWNWAVVDMDAYNALRQSTFNVVSVLTTSGFHTADYGAWGGFATVTFFVMTFIGGCTGSTAGGVKIFRYEVLGAITRVHIRRIVHPHGVFAIAFNRINVPEAVVRSVLGFVMLYYLCFALLALALTMTGLDAVSGLSAAAAALGNVGPGLGALVGPEGNYQALPDLAKWLLCFGMLLGRLELAPVLMLLTRGFWKD